MNAGATHPQSVWLDSLRPGGRLLIPLTVAIDASGHGRGGILKVTRRLGGLEAHFISEVAIFPCIGARDPDANELLQAAFRRHTWESVQSLRRDPHDATENCWLHVRGVCLSTVPVPRDGATSIDGRAAATTEHLQGP